MAQLDLFGDRPTLRQLWERDAAAPRLNGTVPPGDVPRLTASLQRLYDAMKDGGWFTGPQLMEIAGLRYGARLEELKRAGIPFEREHVAEGVWRYRLIASPTNGIAPPAKVPTP